MIFSVIGYIAHDANMNITDVATSGMYGLLSCFMFDILKDMNKGPVVQNFVSLTLLFSPQFVNYISISKANTLSFLLKKCENPLQCKGFSHFFNKK